MTKRKSKWISSIHTNLYEDDTLPHYKGEYLLDERVWMEAGMYMSGYESSMPEIMSDEEITDTVDEFIGRMMK
ncbi:TPA: hypothetical protein ACOAY7_002850 [Vibrio cholerae]